MHHHDTSTEVLTQAIVRYAVDRLRMDPPPLDGPRTAAELRAMAGGTITPRGIGGLEALRIFGDVLAPACISIDHPRFLSFVPAAPTEAAILFDLVVGASSIYAGSWLEGGGAVFAENEALRWIADLAGLPVEAAGVFVSGGTGGNLSALIAARWRWRQRAAGRHDRTRGLIVASEGAHSSVAQSARAMDADVVLVPVGDDGRMTAGALRRTTEDLTTEDHQRLFALVATAGTTNAGVVDDLAAAADAAAGLGTWFHVDAAYGGAALVAPSVRDHFAGIERADSLIVDPHKWLFAPFDSCALVYRDPEIARQAHTQHAEYLDVLHARSMRAEKRLEAPPSRIGDLPQNDGVDELGSMRAEKRLEAPPSRIGDLPQNDAVDDEFNPSDYAHHLSRRARGLPLWFSLATHGTDAYAEAIETTLRVAHAGAELVRSADHVALVLEPELSVVVFRRLGWSADDYRRWSDGQLVAGTSFVTPTAWRGEAVLRWCVVNPITTVDDLAGILDSLR
ncbi:MAG: pyridoxal phosphate-dependent decarboxylase family protein [Desertimonas sp.]